MHDFEFLLSSRKNILSVHLRLEFLTQIITHHFVLFQQNCQRIFRLSFICLYWSITLGYFLTLISGGVSICAIENRLFSCIMFDEDYAHQMQINDLSHTLCTQSKRRKSSIPSKCGLQYVSTNSSDGNEPINLTQKPPLSSRLTNEPEYGPVALKLSEIAGQYNQCSNDTIASSSKFPTNLPFSSIFPMNQTLFPFYKYNREAGNSALIGSVSSPTPMTVSHITDPSSTLDLSKTPPTILRESNGVLQMIKSCLEQIPMPPFGTGCHEPLTLLYSQAMFQAINFQKSVHAYLAELNIKNQQESKGSLNTPLLTPDHTASKVSEMKSPPETESAIDLRLRPDTHIFHRNRRDIEAVFTSFHQTNSAQKVEEDCPNCIQSQNSFYSTSIIQRSPPLTTFSASSLCSAFTSRLPSSSSFSSLSRTSSRSTPSYICGRRCKAVGLKSQKHRSFGGHTTPSSFLGGGAHASSSMHHKKTSFRGTSEEENEVCLKFRPTEHQVRFILLA